MLIPYKRSLIESAKILRQHATPQENKLWYDFLSKHTFKFRRQKIIKGFIVDFYCREALLVIELDGNLHFTEEKIAYDNERSLILNRFNLRVLRFKNSQIDKEFSNCCEKINSVIQEQINKK